MAPFGSRYLEDPSVAQTCALEHDRVWRRIGAKVEGGAWFPRAREQVLAEEIPDIAKAFGRPVAQRVEKAIQQTPQARLPMRARAAVLTGNRMAIETHLLSKRGGVSWFNRLSLRLFGVHFF